MKITLEKPGTKVRITPTANINGISFEPAVFEFDDYWQSDLKFTIKIRSDVIPRGYKILFIKEEI